MCDNHMMMKAHGLSADMVVSQMQSCGSKRIIRGQQVKKGEQPGEKYLLVNERIHSAAASYSI